ncbi:ABC transporter permease [Streptomyces albipurpureus]|uniref:ABC transporter permease n=1 Tax=Streptomyces albipurpureus TaxID=2897419 RepID=A0ABT0UKV3_9ACTN|nr:ABC transporter permease [Streptomyces sp. CWNU-1]MCM2389248.1 ABC transporter permease [Streptomyces sp. CWNU-1]
MTLTQPSLTAVESAPSRANAAGRRLRNRLGATGLVALCWIALMIGCAALAPVIAPHDPNAQDLLHVYAAPGGDHLLGTDGTGRDILSRLIWGARTSLVGPALVVLLSLVVGLPLALAAAWRGGWLDAVVGRFLDIVFSLPAILVAVLAVAVFRPGPAPAILALAVAYLPYVARVARSAALRQRAMPYVAALTVQGHGGVAICARHLLPNITPVVGAQIPIAFANALMDLAALSFLGLAVQSPQADWGVLVNDAQAVLQGHSSQVVYAGVLIIATVVALMLIGDRLGGDIRRRRVRRAPQPTGRTP